MTANQIPQDLRYTKDHEWLRPGQPSCTVGITWFAVDQLGDITLVDLPAEGDLVTKGQRFGTIESVKSVSDLYAPVSGKITKINADLKDRPELVNEDCYTGGWMVEIEPSEPVELAELLTADAYAALTAAE